MEAAAAMVPPLLALILLLRLKTNVAAPVVLGVTVLVAGVVFNADAGTYGDAIERAGPVTVEVLLIILGGLWLNSLLSQGGVNDTVAGWLAGLGMSRRRLVVLVVLGVTPFAESVTGFGIGAVIAIPILVAGGLPPLRAAICGLLGFVAVPWGALSPGTLVGAQIGRVGFQELGVMSAALSLPTYLVYSTAAVILACGRAAVKRALPDILAASGMLWVAILAANYVFGTRVAGAVGAGVCTVLFLLFTGAMERFRIRVTPAFRAAMTPYVLLCGLVIVGRTVRQTVLPEDFPGIAARFVESPAIWLFVTCLATPHLVRSHHPDAQLTGRSLSGAARKWLPVAIATASFLLVGSTMTVSGMSATVAEASSQLGLGYLFVAPLIGALGGLLTGSNVGANAMFADNQGQTAHALGVDRTLVVGFNNVSGSMGSMASGPRIALAAGIVAAGAPIVGQRQHDRQRQSATVNMDRQVFGVTILVVGLTALVYSPLCFLLGMLSR
ncbi:L-lactate permease [Actinomadura rubrisoli]|uniref:L-lactate permease n=1 Tax=Actinomadura rubrisoli TaxID=2530368 RepID=A0A4R5APG7_9ACTN|nr:L-lactate permease [Actinomadura rubrisoli]TDD72212.1 hypothetical protein E1298_35105 [Actinomadura rubrisoli]